MKINRITKTLVIPATFAFSSIALAVTDNVEDEVGSGQNDSVAMAEALGAANAYSIKGVIGILGEGSMGDVDYYSFSASAGDVVTIDIDNGYGGEGAVDTILGIIDPQGNLLDYNNNTSTVDSGSTSIADARLDSVTLPTSGTYTVGVSTYPRFFDLNGNVTETTTTLSPSGPGPAAPGAADTGGDYTLNISGITPRIKQINFEVKPGSKELAPLKPSSKGKVPVAIFGSASFDVSDIDSTSLSFGSTGNEKSLSSCQTQRRDINGDGYADVLCHFKNDAAKFKSGDTSAKMKGKTKKNEEFEGHALLKVIPTKRK
jgi:hypothetical protein